MDDRIFNHRPQAISHFLLELGDCGLRLLQPNRRAWACQLLIGNDLVGDQLNMLRILVVKRSLSPNPQWVDLGFIWITTQILGSVSCKLLRKRRIWRDKDWLVLVERFKDVGRSVIHHLSTTFLHDPAGPKETFKRSSGWRSFLIRSSFSFFCGWEECLEAQLLGRLDVNDLAALAFELILFWHNDSVAVLLGVVLNKEASSLRCGSGFLEVASLVLQANDHALAVRLLGVEETSIVVIAIPDAILGASLFINQERWDARLAGERHCDVLTII